jgi:CelD/BcsL family acetyltransferase involved in cellulose biosynthesis
MSARQSTFSDLLTADTAPDRARGSPAVDILRGPAAATSLLDSVEITQLRRRPGNAFHQQGLLRNMLLAAADRVAVVVVTRDNAIATVWPLRFEHRYGLRVAMDLATPIAQYSDVIGEPLDDIAFGALRTRLLDEFGVDAILCRGVREDSGLARVFAGSVIVDQIAAPFVDLQAFGTFENYCSRFSKRTMRARGQRRRKLEALHGPLEFSVQDGGRGRDALAQGLQWKRQWLDANGFSSRVFSADDQQAVLLAAIDDPAAHVSVLSAHGEPIAVELGFSCAGSYAAFMGAFDPALAACSPGQEQMLLTIEWCFAQGLARYDLLPPRDTYKLHWTRPGDEVKVSEHCVALSTAGRLYALARRHARTPIKRTVLSLPPAVRVAARRYGAAAAGIGATAATFGILAD